MAKIVFDAPIPSGAIDYFNAKKLTPSFDYRDVWREEHAASFTVAKATSLDVLDDIQQAVSSAIAEGKTFAKFQKELKPLLVEKGWWGIQSMTDPLTGEVKDVQLGSPRRLKTIYDANIRTARAASQWEAIQRTKEALPYLLYQLGPSATHRAEHASWNGTLLPADDPFWATHFTPNGYGCKCWVRQISKAEYGTLSKDDTIKTTAPPVEYQDWVNKRTGAIEKVPKGITPGWDTNPGMIRQAALNKVVKDKVAAIESTQTKFWGKKGESIKKAFLKEFSKFKSLFLKSLR